MKLNQKSILTNAFLIALFLALFVATNSYAACSNPIVSLPATLGAEGSYCLTSDMTFTLSGPAITIASNNIVLDFEGFTIVNENSGTEFGVATSGSGTFTNITIKNGRILGFDRGIVLAPNADGEIDVEAFAISNALIDRMYTDDQIHVTGTNVIIRNCTVNMSANSTNNDIAVRGSGMAIMNNDVYGGSNAGIALWGELSGVNNIVLNNRVSNVGGQGIVVQTENSLVINNRVVNSQTGIDMSAVGTGTYLDNLTINCQTPYDKGAGVVNAGNNN